MIAHGLPIYVALEPVDMRLGAERLGPLVREWMHAEPRTRALFMFVGKRGQNLEVLTWDGTGTVVVHKSSTPGGSSCRGRPRRGSSICWSATRRLRCFHLDPRRSAHAAHPRRPDRALRAQDLRPGHRLEHQQLRSMGRGARQAARLEDPAGARRRRPRQLARRFDQRPHQPAQDPPRRSVTNAVTNAVSGVARRRTSSGRASRPRGGSAPAPANRPRAHARSAPS